MGIAAADQNVFRLDGGPQARNHVRDVTPPFRFAESLESANAYVVFERPFSIGQVAEFHWFHEPVGDERGAETRAQSKKKHLSAQVAAERLHRGIVDQPDGALEGRLEIEADPAAPEVVGFGKRAALQDRSRVAVSVSIARS